MEPFLQRTAQTAAAAESQRFQCRSREHPQVGKGCRRNTTKHTATHTGTHTPQTKFKLKVPWAQRKCSCANKEAKNAEETCAGWQRVQGGARLLQRHGRTQLSLKKAVLREKETATSGSQDWKLRDAASEN